MPARDTEQRIDPRYDARFQRGYRGSLDERPNFVGPPDSSTRGASVAETPAAKNAVQEFASDRAQTDQTIPDAADPSATVDGGAWPAPGQHEWAEATTLRPRKAGLGKPLIVLWCVGILLVLIGLASLVVGIRIGIEMSTAGVDGASPMMALGAVAGALVQPTLLVGMATILGVIALHIILPRSESRA